MLHFITAYMSVTENGMYPSKVAFSYDKASHLGVPYVQIKTICGFSGIGLAPNHQ